MPNPRFLFLVPLGLIVAACVPTGSPATTACDDSHAIELEVVEETNDARAIHDALPVRWDDELGTWANNHADAMADAGLPVPWHIDWTVIDTTRWAAGLPADNVQGPNIPPQTPHGMLYGVSGGGFYTSDPHRLNMVDEWHTHVGIGIECRNGLQWVVQMFGTRWEPPA